MALYYDESPPTWVQVLFVVFSGFAVVGAIVALIVVLTTRKGDRDCPEEG